MVAVPCGLWACPTCSKHNARMWAWRAKLQIDTDDRQAFFWTLTMRGGYKKASDAYEDIPRMFDSLRKFIRRENGEWTYLAFVEGQPKRGGMPHFHIISMCGAPYRLKDLAWYYGFGYQAKEIKIESPQAASYVAKYASKGDKSIPKGFRRVRASQDWEKLPPHSRRPYIIAGRDEDVAHYLIRVSEETHLTLDEVGVKWVSFDFKQIEY